MRSSPKSHFFNRNGNENPNPSTSTFGDPDLTSWSGSLDRMQDARLERQRYIMSGMKSEEVDMLALGAKVERALARRMSTQDADMKEGMKAEEETEGVKVDVDEPSLNKSLNEKRAEIAAI
ncbi:hypothetical protein K470DRAFT_262142 [Piedraia hortae CBS 480.64]|uniref:Uncharacterized protein n=1 Tax=Piedraia hortae CBS 480.64 TaxID=1314780 RepID=A0A6A7C7A1_9PEZI|nr:hypothetical protein K470DRAFT_262142 [Piedraia hortae CBS 480.64]